MSLESGNKQVSSILVPNRQAVAGIALKASDATSMEVTGAGVGAV